MNESSCVCVCFCWQVSLQEREAVIRHDPEVGQLDSVCEKIETLGPFTAKRSERRFVDLVLCVEGEYM